MKYRFRYCQGTKATEIEDEGYIDEIVIEKWFHLEEMDRNQYVLFVGDARIVVDARIRQQPRVDIERGFNGEIRGRTIIGEPEKPTPDG